MDIALVKEAITKGNLKFGEAVRQGNSAAIGNLYTDDASILPPNGEMIRGKPAITALWMSHLGMGLKEAVLTTVEVHGMGDLACEVGKYALKIQPAGHPVIEDSGKYVVLWKNQPDGT